MAQDTNEATRRRFFTVAGAGLAATFATAGPAVAAEPTAAERTNMKAVTDFCLAFAAHDPDRIMSFFADPCSYRVLETRDPIKGFAAVRDQIRDLAKNVERFEILDTFARGPMVFNERIDHFKPWRVNSTEVVARGGRLLPERREDCRVARLYDLHAANMSQEV